jgi:hypothetical protein
MKKRNKANIKRGACRIESKKQRNNAKSFFNFRVASHGALFFLFLL